jgi:hypothetical protein
MGRGHWFLIVCLGGGCSLVTDLSTLGGSDASLEAAPDATNTGDASPDATDASAPDAADVALSDATCSDGGAAVVDGVGVSASRPNLQNPSITVGAVSPDDVVVTAFRISGGITVSSIGDDLSDAYTHTAPFTTGGFTYMIAFTTVTTAATTVTITLTLTGVANTILYAVSYKGLAKPTAIDGTKGANGTSGPATSGTVTTKFPRELVFGFGESASGGVSMSAGPSFNTVALTTSGLIEDKVVDCIGSYEATSVLSDAGNWAMMIATFPTK